jgi:esterase
MELFFRKLGAGPPLVILHGLFGSSDNWLTIGKALSEKFTVYLPDLRNHGQSPHSELYGYELMAHDLFELSVSLGLDKFILAGHSMGGKVAVEFARTWPEKVSSLIVLDIDPFARRAAEKGYYDENLGLIETLRNLDLSRVKSRSEAEEALKGKISSEKIKNLVLKNLQRLPDNSFRWKINLETLYINLASIMEGLKEPWPDERITGFPVLFVKGEKSDYLHESDMRHIQDLFPTAEIAIIKNAGHWLHTDAPEEIIRIFLNQI